MSNFELLEQKINLLIKRCSSLQEEVQRFQKLNAQQSKLIKQQQDLINQYETQLRYQAVALSVQATANINDTDTNAVLKAQLEKVIEVLEKNIEIL